MKRSQVLIFVNIFCILLLLFNFACDQDSSRTVSGKVVIIPDTSFTWPPDTTMALAATGLPPVWPPDTAEVVLYLPNIDTDIYSATSVIQKIHTEPGTPQSMQPVEFSFKINNFKPGEYKLGVRIPSYKNVQVEPFFYNEDGIVSSINKASTVLIKDLKSGKLDLNIEVRVPAWHK